MHRRVVWGILLFLAALSPAFAAVPGTFSLSAQIFAEGATCGTEGQLLCGQSIADALVKVSIYDDAVAGALIWSEQQTIDITSGYLSLTLGTVNTTLVEKLSGASEAGKALFLAVELPSGVLPTRLPITSVPYALVCRQAGNAATLGDKSPDYYAPATASFTKAESDDRYLAKGATAVDADKLGAQLPSYYAVATHNHDAAYLGKTAQAVDSAKLEGHAASYFATALEFGELKNTLESAYYTIAELATHFFSKEELLPADATTPGALDSRYPFLAVGQTSNCRLDFTGNSLSVVGRNGQVLSATNVCTVAISDREPLVFDHLVAITFGANSDTQGNTFGTTAGVAWETDARPFFLAACRGSSKPFFAFSLNPVLKATSSKQGHMCKSGGLPQLCDEEFEVFLMDGTLTLSDEVSRPCAVVGSFRATKNINEEWTIRALNESQDGFGKFQEGVVFFMPAGQNGALDGKFTDTGTTFVRNNISYSIHRNGTFDVDWSMGNQTAKGSSARQAHVLPYKVAGTYGMALASAISAGIPNAKAPLAVFYEGKAYFYIYFNDGSYLNGDSLANDTSTFLGATATNVPVYGF